MSNLKEFVPDDAEFTSVHYRRPPWIEGHPTLCGREPQLLAYTANHLKVTCQTCLDTLAALKEVQR